MTPRDYTNWINRSIKDGYITFEQALRLNAEKTTISFEDLPATAPKQRRKRTAKTAAAPLPAVPAMKLDGTPAKRRGRKPKALTSVNGSVITASA